MTILTGEASCDDWRGRLQVLSVPWVGQVPPGLCRERNRARMSSLAIVKVF